MIALGIVSIRELKMCDESPLNIALAAAGFAVAAAIAGILIAIGLNGSFYGAAGSPGAMILAGIASLAAVTALAAAIVAMNAWYSCMVAARPAAAVPCKGALESFTAAAAALIVVLVIQGWASFVVAGIAWIPWVGGSPMLVILAALIIQAALIPTLIVFWQRTRDCINRH